MVQEKGTENNLNLKTFKDLLKIKQFQFAKGSMTFNQIKCETTQCFYHSGYKCGYKLFPRILVVLLNNTNFLINLCSWKIYVVCIQKLIELITICAFLFFIVSLNKNDRSIIIIILILFLVGCFCTSKFSTDSCCWCCWSI